MEINTKDFSEKDWLAYKAQLENSVLVSKMKVLSDMKLIAWIDENLEKFDKKCQTETTSTEEPKNTESVSN